MQIYDRILSSFICIFFVIFTLFSGSVAKLITDGSYLVIRKKSFGLGVLPRLTAASLLVDVGARLIIVVTLTKSERTSIQRYSDD